MPRLVSMTMLTLLTVPLAGLVYFVMYFVTDQVLSWRAAPALFWSSVASYGIVVLSWCVLWHRDVDWRSKWFLTVAATLLAPVVGGLVGFLVYSADRYPREELGIFTGGVSTSIVWMIAVSILWRDTTLTSSAATRHQPAGQSGSDVICPKCGYVLNGLREARCPECGEHYTLDRLFHAQSDGDL